MQNFSNGFLSIFPFKFDLIEVNFLTRAENDETKLARLQQDFVYFS